MFKASRATGYRWAVPFPQTMFVRRESDPIGEDPASDITTEIRFRPTKRQVPGA